GRTADLGAEHEQRDAEHDKQQHREEVRAEPFAHRVGYRALAARRESARHLDEKCDADGAERDRPDELVAEAGSRLRGSGDRADLEEPADARDDSEPDLQESLHAASPSARTVPMTPFDAPAFASPQEPDSGRGGVR